MELDLDGNVALITGSATGLGHACAEAFSKQGANVALASPNLDDLAYASDRLYAIGEGEIFGLDVDIRRPEHVAAFVEQTVDQYGGIDHVVTGPRPLEPRRFLDVSDEEWFRAFDRLFMSVVWTAREAHDWLDSSEHGTVVNVTNPWLRALSGETSVADSFRTAVRGISQAQAATFAPAVRVNTVLPGPHQTEDFERALTELVDEGICDDLDACKAAAMEGCPYESPGEPLDLGKLVAFLSSEHASYVNGAAIPVDGGGT